jgi:hypothetical protein
MGDEHLAIVLTRLSDQPPGSGVVDNLHGPVEFSEDRLVEVLSHWRAGPGVGTNLASTGAERLGEKRRFEENV